VALRPIGVESNMQKIPEVQEDELTEIRQMLPVTPFYKIVTKDRIESIDDYNDRYPCLSLRKIIMKLRVYTNRAA
jgi:hypothetical protein